MKENPRCASDADKPKADSDCASMEIIEFSQHFQPVTMTLTTIKRLKIIRCTRFLSIYLSGLQSKATTHLKADATIHDLIEKIEEYGDSIDIDGFDIDYGNQILTVKFGDLGTYVLNKRIPNRQIWMSSPVRS
ncbi:unnamed protein product [Lactuca virosa]|uniref:Ferroxidase n=1 Tax=Lactuca virosa TaxID=75947 RepID=A0AAU9MAT9_9ASTR|nr:unnamed protein product [Lactuca virosa]